MSNETKPELHFEKVIRIAKSYLNEKIENNESFENKLKASGFQPNMDWSNAFIALVYKEAFEEDFPSLIQSSCKNMYEKTSHILDCGTEIVPGAIFVCETHCGIIIECSKDKDHIVTIEGNITPDGQNYGVYYGNYNNGKGNENSYTEFLEAANSRGGLIGYLYPILRSSAN